MMVDERFPTMDLRTGGLLIVVALLLMIARVMSPLLHRVEGRPMRHLRVPFSAKLRRQRFPLLLLGLVIGARVIAGQGMLGLDLAAAAIAALVLATPAHYVMTDRGIRAGWTPFRRWTEFAGLSVRKGNIRLQPISGFARLEMTLPGRFEDADIVSEMRTLIRLGYQGTEEPGGPGGENGNPPLVVA